MQSTWERGTKAEDGYGTTTLTLYTEYNDTAATHQLTLTPDIGYKDTDARLTDTNKTQTIPPTSIHPDKPDLSNNSFPL